MFKKVANKPVIGTITGEAGLGKTTLAASFENPVFIRGEDGLRSIPEENRPDAGEVIFKIEQLWEQLEFLRKNETEYKTIVIDSVSQLDQLFINNILQDSGKDTINQAYGGYGAGYNALAALHGKIRRYADAFSRKGISTLFICHSDVSTIDLPDCDAYMKYDLALHNKSQAHYVNNVDFVAFIKSQRITRGEGDVKKVVSMGHRVIDCITNPANVSKNRLGITEELDFNLDENPLLQYI